MAKKKKRTPKIRVIPRKKVIKTLSRGMELQGRVRRLAGFGAFVDIGVGTDGLLHISELDPAHRVRQITDVISVGDEITVWIKDLDREHNRISLTMIPPGTMTIDDLEPGMVLTGKVSRLAPYGAFVKLGDGLEGMLHVREMANSYVRAPEDVVSVGEELDVRIIGVDKRRGRIDLSIKGLYPEPEPAANQGTDLDKELPTVMELALREAMGDELPPPKRRQKRPKKRRRKRRSEQLVLDEIISRTLETHRQAA